MRLDQLKADITAEQVNDKFAQIFGEKVNLHSFSTVSYTHLRAHET